MTVRRLGHGVDLNLRSILVLEDLVKVDEDVRSLLLSLSGLETKLGSDLKCFVLRETLVWDGGGDDGRGILSGDFLDVHTTLGRSNEDGRLVYSVVQDGHVVFVCGIAAFREHDLFHMFPC